MFKNIYNHIKELSEGIDKLVFFGSSMGGYASLYMSLFFPEKKCICVSYVPQVTNIELNNISVDKTWYKNAKYYQGTMTKNIRDLLKSVPYNTKIYVSVCKNDCDDEWSGLDIFWKYIRL